VDKIVLYILCLAFGGVGAWFISRWGKRLGLLDRSNNRSSHRGVVPKGGGIGILAAFLIASFFIRIPSTFWIPATFLALFSLLGDKVDFSPKIRLPLQFIAALILVQLSAFSLQSSAFSLFFLVVFIVGTANFYNFMDGINGIAAITGIVGFGLLALHGFLSGGENSFVVLSICISLSCLGFLPFNMPKAKVFMGDVGSILLGFAFAGMVVCLSKSLLDFVCLTSFLFPFYADELATMAARIKDGENLFKPHRRHLYQLLANEKGIPHWKIAIAYGLVQLIVGITILLVKPFGISVILLLLAVYFLSFIIVSSAVRKSLAASA